MFFDNCKLVQGMHDKSKILAMMKDNILGQNTNQNLMITSEKETAFFLINSASKPHKNGLFDPFALT